MQRQATKLALILLFIFQIAKADIIINEICWMGDDASSSNEWIELYNNSNENISLNDWQIVISKEKTINLKGIIPSQGFYLLSRNKNQTEADLFHSKALNNKGEKIELLDENKNIVDLLEFSSGWPYGNNETKQTIERTSEGWQTSLEPKGTPKKENSLIKKEDVKIVNNEEKKTTNNTIIFSLLLSFLSGGIIVFIKKSI